MVATLRQTAQARREAVLEAARPEFAERGLHAASTDAIARRAGISQAYLFRLFGSKKELFLAVNDACFERTLDTFRRAARGKSGGEALRAMGAAYAALVDEDRTMLQGQLQAYAASVDDADVRRSTSEGFGKLVEFVESVSGADYRAVSHFFASGMLFNVLAAMEYTFADGDDDSWAGRLARGCREGP